MTEITNIMSGLLGLVITASVIIATPGPSIMFFIGQVVVRGKNTALHSVIGNAIGMTLIAVILSVGIGSLVMTSGAVLMVIRLVGAAVLIVIGYQYLTLPRHNFQKPDVEEEDVSKPLVSGIIVGFTNPKGFIMFGTIVPSFLSQGLENPVPVLLAYSMIPIVLGLIIDCAWVYTAHAVSSRPFFNSTGMRLVNIAGGSLIIIMALMLIWESVGVYLG
ncbi:LysE family translocator [Parasalinivibrio latis]|uniref:LysE family translocator n=1 Tax=Parasalinivibrio latis TaxID=2952610 RepID=UPI0030E35B43